MVGEGKEVFLVSPLESLWAPRCLLGKHFTSNGSLSPSCCICAGGRGAGGRCPGGSMKEPSSLPVECLHPVGHTALRPIHIISRGCCAVPELLLGRCNSCSNRQGSFSLLPAFFSFRCCSHSVSTRGGQTVACKSHETLWHTLCVSFEILSVG